MACISGLSLGFLAVLIFSGVPHSHAQSGECEAKVTSCNSILMELLSAAENADALKSTCDEKLPLLTTCVEEGKTICAGEEAKIIQLDTMKMTSSSMCASAGNQCISGSLKCMEPIKSLTTAEQEKSKPFSAKILPQMCSSMPAMMTCLGDLDKAGCDTSMIRSRSQLDMMAEICKVMADSKICPDAIECIETLSSGPDNSLNCSAMLDFMSCQKKSSCKASSDGITMEEMISAMQGVCKDMDNATGGDLNCAAVDTCTMRGFGVQGNLSDTMVLVKAFMELFKPKELCRYVEVGTGCYVSEGVSCGLSADFIKKMKSQHENLKLECAKTRSSAGNVVPKLAWMLAALLAWIML